MGARGARGIVSMRGDEGERDADGVVGIEEERVVCMSKECERAFAGTFEWP
jgi:hypothetical protein